MIIIVEIIKISVKVKTGSRNIVVNKIDDKNFIVAVRARAEEGRANASVIATLSDYFQVSKSNVSIVSGELSKRKIIEIIL